MLCNLQRIEALSKHDQEALLRRKVLPIFSTADCVALSITPSLLDILQIQFDGIRVEWFQQQEAITLPSLLEFMTKFQFCAVAARKLEIQRPDFANNAQPDWRRFLYYLPTLSLWEVDAALTSFSWHRDTYGIFQLK
jgi:hypothetical protein